MIKLAKENALIKKLTAIETTGAINVICSDKTGTLTENKMSLEQIFFINKKEHCKKAIWHNVVINSTAEKIVKKGKTQFVGSGTECALLQGFVNAKQGDYKELRDEYKVVKRLPFSSTIKKMATLVEYENSYRIYLKGAPEVLLNLTTLTDFEKKEILYKIEDFESKGKRIICFLHKDVQTVNIDEHGYVYDGFCVLDDKIRKDVFDAIKTCKEAGIKIIMLTGDNLLTATNIAKELKITRGNDLLLTGKEIDEMSDAELKKCLPKISLVARSTPSTKLRVVKILRELNNVVAVTGDGINDAPAIKEADVGIAMATGTEITKEASDVVLLDDSFATIVKAVSFGRNVYQNLQRFILFQLSVNMSAVLFITLSLLITGIAPFNTLQLLWINIIMDGPPALTLGLEATNVSLMKNKPIKKNSSICSKKMFLRILINGVFIAIALLLQQIFNFLNVEEKEFASVIFTAFILFQLFNAFNSRELGTVSIFKSIKKNKIMLTVFGITFLIHVFIVEFLYKPFNIVPLSFLTWVKVLLFTFLIVVISEIYKLLYKLTVKKINKSRKISIN